MDISRFSKWFRPSREEKQETNTVPQNNQGNKPWKNNSNTPPPVTSRPAYQTTTVNKYQSIDILVDIPDEEKYYKETISRDQLSRLKACVPVEEGVDLDGDGKLYTIIHLEKKQAKYKVALRSVATCVFEACDGFLRSNLGRALHNSDRDWYKSCPFVEQGGLTAYNALSVIQELVRPYGVGIQKVYHLAETSISQENAKWFNYLGINPAAKGDRATTNEQYFESISGGNVQIKQKLMEKESFNFQLFTPDAIPQNEPVVFLNFTGHAGGHAHYAAPRENKKGLFIGVVLNHLDKITYREQPPILEFKPNYTKSLDFWNCYTYDMTKKLEAYRTGMPTTPVPAKTEDNVTGFTVVDKRSPTAIEAAETLRTGTPTPAQLAATSAPAEDKPATQPINEIVVGTPAVKQEEINYSTLM